VIHGTMSFTGSAIASAAMAIKRRALAADTKRSTLNVKAIP
jgi:hypothetical protein